MDLTRYWHATRGADNIEVQWTGARPRGGWTLRLLVNGEVKAEDRVGRWADNYEMKHGPYTVNFWGKLFRSRCTISADGKVLADATQPWNAFAFGMIAISPFLGLLLALAIISLKGRG